MSQITMVYPYKVTFAVNFHCRYLFHLRAGIAQWCRELGYGLNDRRFESRQGLGIFLFTTASRPALGPIYPPIQWVPEALSLGVKRPGRKADHSHPSTADVTNTWSYTSTSSIRLHGVALSWITGITLSFAWSFLPSYLLPYTFTLSLSSDANKIETLNTFSSWLRL
jgi:hypothetical protein